LPDAIADEVHPPGTADHIAVLEELLLDAPDWMQTDYTVDETLIFLEAWNRWRNTVMSYLESTYEIPDGDPN